MYSALNEYTAYLELYSPLCKRIFTLVSRLYKEYSQLFSQTIQNDTRCGTLNYTKLHSCIFSYTRTYSQLYSRLYKDKFTSVFRTIQKYTNIYTQNYAKKKKTHITTIILSTHNCSKI